MSTFSGLNTAWTGLTAAQRAMETAGQNLANVHTDGYTRQRVETSAAGPAAQVGRLAGAGTAPGQGVMVLDIARLADAQLDARVRVAAAASGQASAYSAGLERVEEILREPGPEGLSALLDDFWSGWEEVASSPGEQPPAAVLISQAEAVADRLAQMHQQLGSMHRNAQTELRAGVNDLNATAEALAGLNQRIRSASASSGAANEMLDERDRLTERLAELSGAEAQIQADGTADVVLGGTTVVSGTTARSLEVAGSTDLSGTVQLNWSHRDGEAASAVLGSGELAGALALLGPASQDGGGPLASTAVAIDDIAAALAQQVNAVHAQGRTTAGDPGGDFFSFDPDRPAASLAVAVTDASQLAAAAPGAGPLDGSNAARIAELSGAADGPNAGWSALVTAVGTDVRNNAHAAVNAATAHVSSVEAQQANAGVSLDEENVSLLTHQHAYQGAARVMTAIDQMLDTLINRTGVVGR